MGSEERDNALASCQSGEVQVMVATSSFSVGVNKKDVRFVVQAKLPASMMDLIQESGRARCLSDLDDVDLHYEAGRGENGLPPWRCIRGTNAIEGYHKQKVILVPRATKSPRLAHLALTDFNHRTSAKLCATVECPRFWEATTFSIISTTSKTK
ncbi:hypothetical protein DFS34DRAFT_596856 [Phlyctochytrium arcticum]|nr:hypothetical protein DFS34DRAFT_596856 [Phlyctochytrium arcticum]